MTSLEKLSFNRRAEFIIGAFDAIRGLGGAALWAYGVANIFQKRFEEGIIAALGATTLLVAANVLVPAGLERLRRQQSRALMTIAQTLVSSPQGPSVVAINGAIKARLDGVGLYAIKVARSISLLSVPLLVVFGGWLVGVVVVGMFLLSVPFYVVAGRRSSAAAPLAQERRELLGREQMSVFEALQDLRGVGAVPYAQARISAVSTAEQSVILRAVRSTIGSSLTTEFLGGVNVGLVAMIVGFATLYGHTTLSKSLLCVFLVVEISQRFRAWASTFHRSDTAETATELLLSPLPAFVESNPQDALLRLQTTAINGMKNPISLEVHKGSKTLVLGSSGSGKTSLLNVIMGLERARSGDVQPISRKLAHIHPNTFFPSGTLRTILDPSSLCSDSDISTQLEVLGLASPRFRSLDEKFLGQGRTLSDGERVRISIARALLMKVDVFILDDVAGLLDDRSLAAVRRALVEQEHVSLIEAAHERSVLQPDSADCVIRL